MVMGVAPTPRGHNIKQGDIRMIIEAGTKSKQVLHKLFFFSFLLIFVLISAEYRILLLLLALNRRRVLKKPCEK